MLRSLFAAASLVFAFAAPSPAQSGPEETLGGFGAFGSDAASEETVAKLVAEDTAIAPGKPFTVALQLAHPPEWHSYYKNSGGIEKSPGIQWTLPEGFTAGPLQWPVPEIKDGYFGKSFAYSGTPVFLVEITPPATIKAGDNVALKAKAQWQICKETCKDEKADFTLNLKVADAPVPDDSKKALFTKARNAIPKATSAWTYTAESEGSTIKLHLKPGAGAATDLSAADLSFIADQPFVRSLADGGKLDRDPDGGWTLSLQRATKDPLEAAIPQGTSFSGILSAKSPLDTATGSTSVLVSDTAIRRPPPAPLSFWKLLPVLGGMLLGGLILNLMPCVFPVIGLKIMGFVQQAGENRRKVVLHGIIFTLGVLISFWVLSGVLFAARAAAMAKGGSADAIGWGYQLQNPWVVLSLMLMMFVLALNMFGLFEIGTSATSVGGSLQAKQGFSGTFFSGILATLVATPCSAPLLGVAIGTAIGLPATQFFMAFTAMALGLSLPYLVLSAFPKLIDLLPRPGAWMESFKQGMSFLLFATAGYLLWVYAAQIGQDHLLIAIFGLSAIALAAWIFGRWNLPHRKKGTRFTAMALTVLFAAGGFWAIKPPKKSGLVWEHWSPQAVEELTKDGKPVYVDFTATWCATCQVNKRVAYTPEIIKLMKDRGIVTLKADKTSPDPVIEEKLRELGRTAIPVNVLYVPGKDPIITPEVLTPGYLRDLFEKEVPAKES